MEDKPVKMLTVHEVADILHVHPNTVRHWCDQGLLKTYPVGPRGDRRFRPDDIDSFLNMWSRENRGEEVVLAVDDDPNILELVKEAGEKQGYKVRCCDTGEEALDELGRHHYDLVFVDLMLPHVNGLEVLRAIKSDSKDTVVAVITGYGDDPIAMEAMALGPMFFIRKPFDIASITEVFSAIMKTKR